MARALKSWFPEIGRIIQETPDALYARQRALVSAGLIKSSPGRGPGSGVQASAETLAALLIGSLTNATQSENAPIARSIAHATPGLAGSKCQLTGAVTFQKALARILSDKATASRVNEIRVNVNAGLGEILYDGETSELVLKKSLRASVTRAADRVVFLGKTTRAGGLHFGASIPADTIQQLTKAVTKLLEDSENEFVIRFRRYCSVVARIFQSEFASEIVLAVPACAALFQAVA